MRHFPVDESENGSWNDTKDAAKRIVIGGNSGFCDDRNFGGFWGVLLTRKDD